MDFERIFRDIIAFYASELPSYLSALSTQKGGAPLPPPTTVVIDAFDGDKYRDNVVIYVQPQDFSFESLSLQSEIVRNQITNIVTFRGRPSDELMTTSLRYLEAFRNMIRENPTLGSTVDDSRITEAHIYANVEGAPNMTAFEFMLEIESEVA